jgi:UDP-GlcNAc:undecaprenyl-phosphate/decaprenyl-phosphate GlcNAc-1-phosphate transferase
MHALPFALALVCAVVLAPALLRALRRSGHTRPNYRQRPLPCPFGVLVLAAGAVALVPLALVQHFDAGEVFHPEETTVLVYGLGVLALGLLDDTLGRYGAAAGSGEREEGRDLDLAPRGWRGHGAAAMRGELSTGALKAVGSLGLALLALDHRGLSDGRWLLAAGVLVLATNAFNLLDLRPGRSTKAFVLLGAGLAIGSASLRPLWSLGLFAAPALVAGVYDLRERAMLGDTGANLLGGLAGLWLVLTLSATGQLIALAVLALLTLYGELRSISALVERTPLLRRIDAWGRP